MVYEIQWIKMHGETMQQAVLFSVNRNPRPSLSTLVSQLFPTHDRL